MRHLDDILDASEFVYDLFVKLHQCKNLTI